MTREAMVALLVLALLTTGCPPGEPTPDAALTRSEDASEPPNDAADPRDAPAADAPGVMSDAGVDAAATEDAPSPLVDAGRPDGGAVPCAMEGARRRLPCECGSTRVETCSGGYWMEFTPCEVECIPGTVEPTDPELEHLCSESYRTCGLDCRWGPRMYTVLPGECDPLDADVCGDPPYFNCRCTLSCTCIDVPGCTFTRP